jgi:hypothetical protein
MNKYKTSYKDLAPSYYTASEEKVESKYYKLQREGDTYILFDKLDSEIEAITIPGHLFCYLPELLTILGMEDTNLFEPTTIEKLSEKITIFNKIEVASDV